MALIFRWLVGVPFFVISCLLSISGVYLAIEPNSLETFPKPANLPFLGLALFFAVLAYAIWRILLYRRAETARPPDDAKPSP